MSRLFKIDIDLIKKDDQDVKTSPFLESPVPSRGGSNEEPPTDLRSEFIEYLASLPARGQEAKPQKNKTLLMYNISKRSQKRNENIETFKKNVSPESSPVLEKYSKTKPIDISGSHKVSKSLETTLTLRNRSPDPRNDTPGFRPVENSLSEFSKSLKRSRSLSEPVTNPLSKAGSRKSTLLIEPSFYNDTSIEDVLYFIFQYKLKLNVDIINYVEIFQKNLIITYEILCKQTPSNIEKLDLPLALETEIKTLIGSKNMKKIKNVKDINPEVKQKLKESWIEIRNDNEKLNSFVTLFYKNLIKNISLSPHLGAKNEIETIIKNIGIKNQVNKIITAISYLLNFIDNDINQEEINRLALIHLLILPIPALHEILYDDFARAVADTVCQVLDPDSDSIYYASSINNIKDGWYIITKVFGNMIYQEYDYLKKGKMFQIYLRKSKSSKWSKHYCNISHDKIIMSTFPKFDKQKTIALEDILSLEKIDNDDHRMIKQTDWCFKLVCKDIDYNICTDIKDSMEEMYSMLKIRMDIIDSGHGPNRSDLS